MAGKQKRPFVTLFLISYILFLLSFHSSVSSAAEVEIFGALNRKFALNNGILVSKESEKYAVIFDAGSTCSRVHVFRFDPNLDLLCIGNDFEFFVRTKPGLTSYADDPKGAALSLKPLLEEGQAVVPEDLRPKTPVKLGATGLRMLKNGAADRILEAVRDLFKQSSLEYRAEWVSILDGSPQAGYFMWTTINYLLGNIGKPYPQTVCSLDLGSGSVQIDLYYGQLAARTEIFKATKNSSNPCILDGYDGFYTYGGVVHKASSPPNGSSYTKCRTVTLKALKITAPCSYDQCTFNGTWNGGGGAGQNHIYLSSFFFDIAKEAGIISPDVYSGKARPIDFRNKAKVACATKYEDVKTVFPNVYDEDLQ